MFLSRIRPTTDASTFRFLTQVAGGPYRIHQALWELFNSDPDAQRDFLFHQQGRDDALSFLLLSRRSPKDNQGLWHIETKKFAPLLQPGDRLAFSVRINPVVKRRNSQGKQQRHDLVMDLKKSAKDSDLEQTQADQVQQAAHLWLSAREQQYGYQLDSDSLIGGAYRKWRFTGKGGRPISYSSIDCSGQLSVTDPNAFTTALMNGIGPAKAFGCGLLLIRPA